MTLNPLDLIPPQYKVAAELAVLALALAAAGACGWAVNGWRLGTDLAKKDTAHAQEQAKALAAAVAQRDGAIHDRDALAAKLAAVDADGNETLRRLTHENDSLRAGAAAGTVGVRVIGAHCPAAHDVPQAAPGSGVDSDAGPELDADARQRYFALREAVGATVVQLNTCSASLGALTGQRAPLPAVAPGAASNAP